MVLTIVIASLTAVTMIATVLTKPYLKIKKLSIGLYWVVCLLGALAMLFYGQISFSSAFNGITANSSVNPLKILTLFLSMTLLSVYLGDAGFFDYIADKVFLKTKGGKIKLFLLLYLVVSILTVFTSNDVIILTFTPPICIFAKKAKISPLPFLLGEFVAANTWSMMLIIGNPTNIYLAGSFGVTFTEYLSVMFLPALVGGITGLIMIFFLFRKDLLSAMPQTDALHHGAPHKIIKHKTPLIVAICHLCLCIILLAVSEFIGVEMWIICLMLALSMTVFDLVYDLIVEHTLVPVLISLKKEPYELIPFVLSMFIIVLALKECGATAALNGLLITGGKTDALSIGLLSALSANLLNNIPMSVLFEGVIFGTSVPALYGAVIGSNIGAFITPVGALAGIMWNKILSRYGQNLSFVKFCAYGIVVAVPTLLSSIGALLIVL